VFYLPYIQGSIVGRDVEERLSIRRDKSHVLFGGTKILQHTPDKVKALFFSKYPVLTYFQRRCTRVFFLLTVVCLVMV
jgi:hypothetical protein